MKIIRKQLVIIAVLLFGACNPLEDELAIVEADNSIPSADIVYTLTEDDYDTADDICGCAGFGSFSDDEDVRTTVPAVLADVFPALGNGSSAQVTYDFFRGFTAPEAQDWLDAADDDRYTVSDSDYEDVGAETGTFGFFNNTVTVEDNISNVLNAGITSPADGDLIAVTYKWSATEYADAPLVEFTENFGDVVGTSDLGDMQVVSVSGAEEWENDDSSSGYNYGGMSGFGGAGDNVDWMITPQIDLAGFTNATLRLQMVLNFLGAQVRGTDVAIMVSTDYDPVGADPSAATWTNLVPNAADWIAGDSFDQENMDASLSAFSGQMIYVGFFYQDTPADAPLWRIIDVEVSQGEGEIEIATINEFYQFDGTAWGTVGEGDIYFVNSTDYKVMGLNFPNFSSSNGAENYLPQFLATTLLPFAQEDDTQVVIYDYFSSSSGAQVRADFYTFTGGQWVEWESTVPQTLGFAHNGTQWEADNTIKYSLTGDDYTSIAAAYAGTNPDGSGSMESFGNYDIGLWSSTEIFESITARLETLFGPIPAGQKYLVSYAVWKPGNDIFEIHVIYDGSAWARVSE